MKHIMFAMNHIMFAMKHIMFALKHIMFAMKHVIFALERIEINMSFENLMFVNEQNVVEITSYVVQLKKLKFWLAFFG